MEVNFKYGPNNDDSALFDVGPVTMNEQEAMQMAFAIVGHYRPAMFAAKNITPALPENEHACLPK